MSSSPGGRALSWKAHALAPLASAGARAPQRRVRLLSHRLTGPAAALVAVGETGAQRCGRGLAACAVGSVPTCSRAAAPDGRLRYKRRRRLHRHGRARCFAPGVRAPTSGDAPTGRAGKALECGVGPRRRLHRQRRIRGLACGGAMLLPAGVARQARAHQRERSRRSRPRSSLGRSLASDAALPDRRAERLRSSSLCSL